MAQYKGLYKEFDLWPGLATKPTDAPILAPQNIGMAIQNLIFSLHNDCTPKWKIKGLSPTFGWVLSQRPSRPK